MTDKERKTLQKKNFMRLIFSYLHEPYKWGGENAEEGFDCSGMVVDAMHGVGLLEPAEDYTANSLFKLFSVRGKLIEEVANKNEPMLAQKGDLLFWFKDDGHCYHIAVAVDKLFCMTADGGGSKINTLQDAIDHNAFVKIRPIAHRKDKLRIVRIF